MIELKFTKQLGDMTLAVDLELPETGITAIFGRSGAGKSSLINAVSGIIEPDHGFIAINGKTLYCNEPKHSNGHDAFALNKKINVAIEKRHVGYVFQDARLFPHLTVRANLNYGVKKKKLLHQPSFSSQESNIDQGDNVDQESYFEQIVMLLALSTLLDRKPIDLSGGEQQRVAIARALLSSPDILLMDEPLASLDLPRKKEIMPFLERLSKKVNIPILYVTHSVQEILRLANHMVVINHGKIEISGSIEQVWSSKIMRPWQSFSDQSSLYRAKLKQHHHQYGLSYLLLTPKVGLWTQKISAPLDSVIRLQIRASDVSITLEQARQTSIRNVLEATIESIEVDDKTQQTMVMNDAAITNDFIERQSAHVQLKLDHDCYLWATITAWAMDELNLVLGQRVYAQIKGVSVAQRDMSWLS